MTDLSNVPSVDSFLRDPLVSQLIATYGRSLTLSAIRAVQAELRHNLSEGHSLPDQKTVIEALDSTLQNWLKPTLIPVINASGVILHTNLGRAPLSQSALQAVRETASGYSTLEYDLDKGKRGSRLIHAEQLLKRLTGCEAALVVNNNAGAVLLALAALANRRKVVISRSQLVEIGGGFRIPDVMRQSGAKLIEIGTTNRTHLADYEKALQDGASLVLIAHHSNFKLQGFSTEPSLSEIADLAHAFHLPVLHDLGSGAFLNTENYGLTHETTIQDSLAAGCDLVCFSGDKLLGGPQAGIIVGKKALLDKIHKHPLARALRSDKLCLAALSATLLHYLTDEADAQIPLYQMLSRSLESLHAQAQVWINTLGTGEIIPGRSTTGGGSLPEEELDTWCLALSAQKPEKFLSILRRQNPPIIARIQNDQIIFDPRTIMDYQESSFIKGLQTALLIMKEKE